MRLGATCNYSGFLFQSQMLHDKVQNGNSANSPSSQTGPPWYQVIVLCPDPLQHETNQVTINRRPSKDSIHGRWNLKHQDGQIINVMHKDNTVHMVEVHRDVAHKEANLQLDMWQSATWDMNMSPCSLQYTYSLGHSCNWLKKRRGRGVGKMYTVWKQQYYRHVQLSANWMRQSARRLASHTSLVRVG